MDLYSIIYIMISKIKKLFKNNHQYINHYQVDIHSHLIPGIDDGSKTIQESVLLVKSLKELGFKKLITTPHIMHHRYPNSSEIILSGLKDLKLELKNQKVDIEIEAASEYYLDEHFMKLLKKRDILTFGDKYLLFEMSYGLKPLNLMSTIFEMKVAGYQPVLAHPERYLFMHRDFKVYEKLKEEGVLFQLNLNSLGGYYSKPVQKIAQKLVQNGWIDFLGSDTHKESHLQHFSKNLNSKTLSKIFKTNVIRNEQLL